MNKAYRDMCQDGPHDVTLDGCTLRFDADGLLRNPDPDIEAVLRDNALRRARFCLVELLTPHVISEPVPEPSAEKENEV